jgi:hypothetical protein
VRFRLLGALLGLISVEGAMIWRIMLLMGSSPSSWVIEISRTPFLASGGRRTRAGTGRGRSG